VCGVPRFGNEFQVHLDGHEATGQAKFVEQSGDGQAIGRGMRLAVDNDLHAVYLVPGPPAAGPAAARKETMSTSVMGLTGGGVGPRCMAVDQGRL
jgi:hypothetical protein